MIDNYNSIEDELKNSGSVCCCTSGMSMYPMLRNRKDMVIIEKANGYFKKYDVVLYRVKSGKLVLHRIIGIEGGKYIIRGDNLLEKEYGITDNNIIGVLESFCRNGHYINCNKNYLYNFYKRFIVLIFPIKKYKNQLRTFSVRILKKFKGA